MCNSLEFYSDFKYIGSHILDLLHYELQRGMGGGEYICLFTECIFKTKLLPVPQVFITIIPSNGDCNFDTEL
jgi:hypothetical protein